MKYSKQYIDDIKAVLENINNLKNLYNQKILITGATGMICSSIVDILFYLNSNLNANIKIILAGRDKKRLIKRFSLYSCDIDYFFLEYDATKNQDINLNVDYIIHGASNANPSSYVKQPVETILANITGLDVLLRLARKVNPKKLVFISSSEVYGRIDGKKDLEEGNYGLIDILNLRACYPNSKRLAETLCIAYAEEYDINVTIARPGHIYGPTITLQDDRASAQFTKFSMSKQDIIMKSSGLQLRSYCYVLDCASAILTILLNGENGNAYNISNKKSIVSIRNVAEEFSKSSGVSLKFENASDYEKKGYNMMDNVCLKSDKLEKLGWKAIFDLKTGVDHTLELMNYGMKYGK